MTLEQFTTKWLGGRTDYDKVYAHQCVDLILQYLAEVHGITSGVRGNAIDYWTKPSARLLQDFEKTTGTPQYGDIVILNATPTNEYGHILIAVNGTTAIEQNGATGDGDGKGGDEVRYRTIPLSRVAGLLRKKGTDDMITQNDVGPVRIVMSEVEGWNGHDIHSGKNDAQIMSAWVGQKWTTFLQHCWNVQQTHRIHLEEAIQTLNKRPTQEQLDEQVRITSIKDSEIARIAKEKEALQAQLAVVSEDTELLNGFGKWLTKLIARIGLNKG